MNQDFKVGDIVVIVANLTGHEHNIDELVELTAVAEAPGFDFITDSGWYVNIDEIKPYDYFESSHRVLSQINATTAEQLTTAAYEAYQNLPSDHVAREGFGQITFIEGFAAGVKWKEAEKELTTPAVIDGKSGVVLSANRTCNECRAFEMSDGYHGKCSLGYHQEFGEPKERCPKPKTIKRFVELLKH